MGTGEINDAEGRANYLQKLIELGYTIHSIAEKDYSNLTNNEDSNLYQIVLASAYQIGRIRSYLCRFVKKSDTFDVVKNY